MIERLQIFIDNQTISIRAFEIKIGASDGMIRRAIKNNTDIQSKWLSNIADNYPKLNLEWLITGRGEMFSTFFETKCVQNAFKLDEGNNEGFLVGKRNVHKTPSFASSEVVPTTIYKRDPRDTDIIELQKKHIALLEQQVASMAEQISELKKPKFCGIPINMSNTPPVEPSPPAAAESKPASSKKPNKTSIKSEIHT